MDDVLEVGLQGPTVPHLVLIDRSQQGLKIAHRPNRIDQCAVIRVECLSSLGDVRITRCDPELIVGPAVAEPDELEAGIGI